MANYGLLSASKPFIETNCPEHCYPTLTLTLMLGMEVNYCDKLSKQTLGNPLVSLKPVSILTKFCVDLTHFMVLYLATSF